MTTATYSIPACNIDLLKNEVEKMNKRIAKLNKKNDAGLSPIEMVVSAPVVEGTEIFFSVTISGEIVTVAGWTFIATLTHMDEGVVIRAVPGTTTDGELAKYRDEESKCDQCGWKRRRLDTYVLRNEAGEHKVVGSTCLGDFFPNANPHAAASYAETYASISAFAGACEDNEFGGGQGEAKYRTISSYLPYVALVTRNQGWVSGSKAWEMGDKSMATAYIAWDLMNKRNPSEDEKPSEKDISAAAPVVAFINEHYENNPPAADKDFDQNMAIVFKGGVVDFRLKGIAAFGIEFMKKEIAYRANKAAEKAIAEKFGGLNPANSTFQGDASKKNQVFKALTCVDAGGRRPVKFVDAAGNLFKCWSNKLDFQPIPGVSYDLRTSSIAHEEDKYNQNAKTTSLGKTRMATEKELATKPRTVKANKLAVLAAAING
jgi:hypothetical protein